MRSRKIEHGFDEEVIHIAKSGKLKNKIICVMGSLLKVDRVNQLLASCGYKVSFGLDNNTSLCGTQIVNKTEYTVITPQELSSRYNDRDVIIFVYSQPYWLEMREQLEELGYKNNKQFFLLEAPSPVRKKIKYVIKGKRLYHKLVKKYGQDTLFFAAYGPLGDNYLFSLFYKAYLKENGKRNYIFVGNHVTEKIMQLRGEQRFEKVETEDIMSLESYYMFSCGAIRNLKFLQMWEFMFHFNPCRLRLEHQFSFLDSFRRFSFGLGEEIKPDFPLLQEEKAVADIFEKLHLRKKKTVILAPYAYSITQHVPERFWTVLARKLTDRGYDLVLNIDAEKERNFLEGVPAFMIPIKDMRECLYYAGNIIAMRSGLCDIIGDVPARKVILYPKQYSDKLNLSKHRPDMEFGSLKNMELCADAVELEFEETLEEDEYWLKFAGEIDKIFI